MLGRGINGGVGESGQIVKSDGVVRRVEDKPHAHDANKQETEDRVSVLRLPFKEQRVGGEVIERRGLRIVLGERQDAVDVVLQELEQFRVLRAMVGETDSIQELK